jgi:hypothetical protein
LLSTAITTASTDDNLPEPIDRESAFLRNLFIEPSVMQAALKAGYSEAYSKGDIYTRLRTSKFQEKVREYARTHELIESISVIMRLEHNALKWLQDKPQELPKYASILKQKKQIAGLLSQDTAPAQATISIGQVANLMLNVSQVDQTQANNEPVIISVDDK